MTEHLRHPEYSTGKWISNTNEDDFELLFVRNEPHPIYGQSLELDNSMEYMAGPPVGNNGITAQKLVDMNLVGVYIRPKQSKKDEKSVLELIADSIRSGTECSDGWNIEIDHSRVDDEDRKTVVNAIAGFVEDGIEGGFNPFWKLIIIDMSLIIPPPASNINKVELIDTFTVSYGNYISTKLNNP